MNLTRVTLFLLLALVASVCCGERYKDRLFEVRVTRDVVFSKDVLFLCKKHMISTLFSGLGLPADIAPPLYFYQNDCELKKQHLRLDLYEPKIDTSVERPLVIVVHGGGFIAGDKRDSSQQIVQYCDSLAARGFVVASIDYRKGLVLQTKMGELILDSTDFKRATLWAAQDLDSAIHFFRVHANELKINPHKIIALGNSSGAITALYNVYGNFENQADAVVSLWGSVLDLDIDYSKKNPVLLIHGTEDVVLPFKRGRTMSLDSLKDDELYPGYRNFLSTFTVRFESPVFYGSGSLDSALAQNNVYHETLFLEGYGHELYNEEKIAGIIWDKIIDFLYRMVQ